MKKSKKKVINALAVLDKDGKICTTADGHGLKTQQMAIYGNQATFSKKVMKEYKVKIIPVIITYSL